MKNPDVVRALGKWGGRLTAALMVLFWGAFFVEHVNEWFLRGGGKVPPPMVWGAMALHFMMLAGYALMLRWDRLGAAVALVFSIAFFAFIGIYSHRFVYPALVNLVPIGLFCLYWFVPARRSGG